MGSGLNFTKEMCEVPYLGVSEQHAGHGTPDSAGSDHYMAGSLGTNLWE